MRTVATDQLIESRIRSWARGALHSRAQAGSFIMNIAKAILRADPENFEILRLAAIELVGKYPKYLEFDLTRRLTELLEEFDT